MHIFVIKIKAGFSFYIGFVFLSILFTSCSSSHKLNTTTYASKPSPPSFSGSAFVKKYSEKLGIQLNEGMNKDLIETVADWMGVPYKYGGDTKSGADCSGFITQVFLKVYQLKLPRTAYQLHQQSTSVKTSALKEGDLVFFKINTKETGHAGIYLLDGYFVHASTSRGVTVSKLADAYWTKYYDGAGSFL